MSTMRCQRNYQRPMALRAGCGVLLGLAFAAWMSAGQTPKIAVAATTSSTSVAVDRSPIDLVLTPDEKWLVTANQASNSLSLVNVADGVVVSEVPCGRKPA